jgi:hypothetical protein
VPKGMTGVEIPPIDYAIIKYKGILLICIQEKIQSLFTHIYITHCFPTMAYASEMVNLSYKVIIPIKWQKVIS